MVGEVFEYLVPAFSSDSQILYAGGIVSDGQTARLKIHYSCLAGQGKGPYTDVEVSNNSITDLKPRDKGGLFLCGMAPDWGILNADNQIEMYHAPRSIEFYPLGQTTTCG
jgi:hypothetical protein